MMEADETERKEPIVEELLRKHLRCSAVNRHLIPRRLPHRKYHTISPYRVGDGLRSGGFLV